MILRAANPDSTMNCSVYQTNGCVSGHFGVIFPFPVITPSPFLQQEDSMRKNFAIAAIVAMVTATSQAGAQLATFDDLPGCTPDNNGGIRIDNGYLGFQWTNFWVINGPAAAALYGGPGYGNGNVSPECVAYNGFGEPSTITSATSFTFNGGFFTAAFDNELSVKITAFDGLIEKYSSTLQLNTTTPYLFDADWVGVDRVEFQSGNNAPGSQFVFDNFRFNNAVDPSIVPEPSTLVLLASGFVVLGMVSRRRARES